MPTSKRKAAVPAPTTVSAGLAARPAKVRPARRIPSLQAERNLRKLGQDIAIARKRRQFTQKRLAMGASVNVATIRRLENGDPGVSLGTLAMVLLVLGESARMGDLLDVARDDVGLTLSVTALPKRVREPGRKPPSGSSGERGEAVLDTGGSPNSEGW